MNNNKKRMVLYVPDMMQLTGRSERTVRRWIAAIKKNRNNNISTMISIEEFCGYTGFTEEKVMAFLN